MSSTRLTQKFTVESYTLEVGIEQTSQNFIACTFYGLEDASRFVGWAETLGFKLQAALAGTIDTLLNSGKDLSSIKLSLSTQMYSSLAFYNEYKENNVQEQKHSAPPAQIDEDYALAVALSLEENPGQPAHLVVEQKHHDQANSILEQESKEAEAERRAAIAADQYWTMMEEQEAAAEAELRAANMPAILALAQEQSAREEDQRKVVNALQTHIKNQVYYRQKEDTTVSETINKIKDLEEKQAPTLNDSLAAKRGLFSKRAITQSVEETTIYNSIFNFYNDL